MEESKLANNAKLLPKNELNADINLRKHQLSQQIRVSRSNNSINDSTTEKILQSKSFKNESIPHVRRLLPNDIRRSKENVS